MGSRSEASMRDDGPTEQVLEVARLLGPCSNSFHPTVSYSSVTTLNTSEQSTLFCTVCRCPAGDQLNTWTSWPQGPESPTLRPTPATAYGMAPVPSSQGCRKRAIGDVKRRKKKIKNTKIKKTKKKNPK